MKKIFEDGISAEVSKINGYLYNVPELEIKENSPWEKVLEAEKYALSAGGKRIRAVMVVEFYKLFSGEISPPPQVYEAACAIEMTHTFSLIHDDMPEMDDDDTRRGKPSTHIAYGTAEALLAGDGLAILPYEIIARLSEEGKISPETAVKLISVLSKNAGNKGMIAGQTLDLWSEGRHEEIDEPFLRKMSKLKTGRMLIASCVFGAVLAGADGEKLRDAEKYAENIGLAFQIIDDILDVTSDASTLGKPIGSDKERHKPTFADLLGISGAQKEAERLSGEAAGVLEKYPGSELLREYAVELCRRKF